MRPALPPLRHRIVGESLLLCVCLALASTTTEINFRASVQSANVCVGVTVIQPGDDTPTGGCWNGLYTTNEDTVLTVPPAQGVIPTEDPALSASVITNTTNGDLILNSDGSFVYSPDNNYNGSDSFVYQIDGGPEPITGTAYITINAVNDAPVAVADSYSVLVNVTLNISASNGVLDNDTDVELDTLSGVLITNVGSGTLLLQGDGSFTYTPNTDFVGTDTFTYRASDGNLTSSITTVTITVSALPPSSSSSSITSSQATSANPEQEGDNEDGGWRGDCAPRYGNSSRTGCGSASSRSSSSSQTRFERMLERLNARMAEEMIRATWPWPSISLWLRLREIPALPVPVTPPTLTPTEGSSSISATTPIAGSAVSSQGVDEPDSGYGAYSSTSIANTPQNDDILPSLEPIDPNGANQPVFGAPNPSLPPVVHNAADKPITSGERSLWLFFLFWILLLIRLIIWGIRASMNSTEK